MTANPFSHRRVGAVVFAVGAIVVLAMRPSSFDRAAQIAHAPWTDIDDLWPVRLALEPAARAGDPCATALLARVLARIGEPMPAPAGDFNAKSQRGKAAKSETCSLGVSASLRLSHLHPTRERLLAAAAIEQNNPTAIRHWLSKTWRTDFVWSARMLARLETLEGRPWLARFFLASLRRKLPQYRYLEREIARTFTAERRFTAAARVIQREIAATPNDVRPYWELATIALHANNLSLAYETYQTLYRNVPHEPDVPFYVCEMARHVKPTEEALRVCAHARRLRPNDARIALEVARDLTLLGRTDEAQSLLVADRDRTPTHPEPWRALLTWEFENRFYENAARVATQAAPLFPTETWHTEALSRARHERLAADVL